MGALDGQAEEANLAALPASLIERASNPLIAGMKILNRWP